MKNLYIVIGEGGVNSVQSNMHMFAITTKVKLVNKYKKV
jgi:hypothetical protein